LEEQFSATLLEGGVRRAKLKFDKFGIALLNVYDFLFRERLVAIRRNRDCDGSFGQVLGDNSIACGSGGSAID
jgi:hypothetical protein